MASLTKSFTATALGMLLDEGKIAWDDHVRRLGLGAAAISLFFPPLRRPVVPQPA